MSRVGPLLSELRRSRRMSQLDLSVLADVSSRHISFIENGRSTPSRDMLLRLADVLDLPLRDSNLLLSAGGFAMSYSHNTIDAVEMQPVKEALQLMMDSHDPYPALVMDTCWNIVMANTSQQKIMALLPPLQQAGDNGNNQPRNLLHMLFDSQGLRPLIENWDELAGYLLRRLKKQVLMFNQPQVDKLYKQLLLMDPPANWKQPPGREMEGPMITVRFRVGEVTLSLFSTISHFGSALDVGMEEMVIESYFPADETTKAFFLAL